MKLYSSYFGRIHKEYVLSKLQVGMLMFWSGKHWVNNKWICPTYSLKKVREYAKVMGCSWMELKID